MEALVLFTFVILLFVFYFGVLFGLPMLILWIGSKLSKSKN